MAIADKAASSMGETPATNITQTETPPLDNTAEPVSESTPLLPCNGKMSHSRFKVQGSLLFVTYTIIQGIIGSEMLVRTGPLNGKCKKEK